MRIRAVVSALELTIIIITVIRDQSVQDSLNSFVSVSVMVVRVSLANVVSRLTSLIRSVKL